MSPSFILFFVVVSTMVVATAVFIYFEGKLKDYDPDRNPEEETKKKEVNEQE